MKGVSVMFNFKYSFGHIFKFQLSVLFEGEPDFPEYNNLIPFLTSKDWKLPIDFGQFYDMLIHGEHKLISEESQFYGLNGENIGSETFKYHDIKGRLAVARLTCYDMGLESNYDNSDLNILSANNVDFGEKNKMMEANADMQRNIRNISNISTFFLWDRILDTIFGCRRNRRG